MRSFREQPRWPSCGVRIKQLMPVDMVALLLTGWQAVYAIVFGAYFRSDAAARRCAIDVGQGLKALLLHLRSSRRTDHAYQPYALVLQNSQLECESSWLAEQ